MTSEPLEKPAVAAARGVAGGWRSVVTPARVRRLVKFGVVGASGVVVNLAVFEVAYRFVLSATAVGTRVTLANAAGLVISIFTNFVLNDKWTWGDRAKGELRHWLGRMFKYYVSASVAGGVQLVVTWLAFKHVFGDLALEVPIPEGVSGVVPTVGGVYDVSPTIAVLTGIACGMVLNFLAGHLWAFRNVEGEE